MKEKIYIIGNRRGKRLAERKFKKAKYYNTRFIVLPVVLPVHVVQGFIKYPKGGKLRIAAHATNIVTMCTANTNVTIAGADITAVTNKVTAYSTATNANRAGKKREMTQAIEEKLLAPFQAAANANPVNAILILESGGFHVKVQVIPQIHQFEVENGLTEGMVEIKTAGGPQRKAHLHNWYSSTDGINFDWEKSTNAANTELGPYTSGAKMYFQEELSIQDVLQGRSGTIDIRIK
jgi:hypothetical protein